MQYCLGQRIAPPADDSPPANLCLLASKAALLADYGWWAKRLRIRTSREARSSAAAVANARHQKS